MSRDFPVLAVDLSDVILHPDIVINIRTMGDMRVADLHVQKLPSVRNVEQFAVVVDQHSITLTKEITRKSIVEFLIAFKIPFKLL